MPRFLRQWIASLENDDARELWDFLDGNPVAISLMIKTVVDTHQYLKHEDKQS